MVDERIGRLGWTQRLPRMAPLPTRPLAEGLPQADYPHWLLQPVARWRFAAVTAVQPDPTLQFGNACLHRRDLGRMAYFLRQQQGDVVALRQLLKGDVVRRHPGSSLVNQNLAPEPPSSDGTTAE
jgi:hypothetical protein